VIIRQSGTVATVPPGGIGREVDDRNSPPPPPTVEGRTETTEEGEAAESDVAQSARARRSVGGWRGDRADGGTTRARRTAALEERGEDPRKRMQIMRAARSPLPN